mgnify:CR=1
MFMYLLLITALRNLLNLLNLHIFPPRYLSRGGVFEQITIEKKIHREIAKPVLVVEESF